MKVPLFIALRYLSAKKSHNVINVISTISVVGMAIGTAALILILSVYNGFDAIIKDNLSDLDPDILAVPREGKFFVPETSVVEVLKNDGRVETVQEILEEKVFIRYSGTEDIATLRGISPEGEQTTELRGHVIEGTFSLQKGDVRLAAVGAGLSGKLGISPRFTQALELFYPDGDTPASVSMGAAALNTAKVRPSCVFSISADTDESMVVVPIGTMRELLGREGIVSGLEIRLKDGSDKNVRKFISDYEDTLKLNLLSRYRQHEALFRMMKYEKLAIFLILVFVVIIVAFNIYGSLAMLRIEKAEDIRTLHAMGAGNSFTDSIFVLEGVLGTVLGMASGLAAGILLTLLQQRFGIVKMPGNYLIDAYPVVLQGGDILMTALGVLAVGTVISLSGKAKEPGN